MIVDVPIDPKELNRDYLSVKALLYDETRKLVGEFLPGHGLIVAIIDVEDLNESFRVPTDCRVYVRVRARVLIFDVDNDEPVVGVVKKTSGKYITIALGQFAQGTCHVSHLGPNKDVRYEIEEDTVYKVFHDGSREQYLKVNNRVRAKVSGGVSERRGLKNLRLTMRGSRYGPLRVIKEKREKVLRE